MSGTSQPYKIVERELFEYFALGDEGFALPEDFNTPICDLPPLAWAEAHRRLEGRQFSLDYIPELNEGYEPLKDIYNDTHPFIVIMKPAQVGVSELAICRALHALDVGARFYNTQSDGLNVGYLFPTQDALLDFTKERFDGIKGETDYLGALFTDVDNARLKKARNSYLYLRGAWSTKAVKSFKADLLILDERDEMLSSAVALAEKRLRHSRIKMQFRLSTPTKPGKGIHADYLRSDQRVWEVNCSACGEWNELNFFRDVKCDGADYEDWKLWEPERVHTAEVAVCCPSCHHPLCDADRFGPGRWVARQPEVTAIRGYHVPALSFPRVDIRKLCVTAISDEPQQVLEFFRSDLGVPYEQEGSSITETMLKKLSSDLPGGRLPEGVKWRKVTMGVDVGKRFHFRISGTGPDNRRYVLKMGWVRGWDELDALMEEFGVRHCVIDKDPELSACEAWATKHKGKVTRAHYPTGANALKGVLFAPEAEKIEGLVQINRTMAMDTVYSIVATGKEVWPTQIHNDPEVISHMTAPTRVIVENDEGQPRATWVHTKRDDLFHACVYDHIALATLPKKLPGVALGLGSARGWGFD
jgi:hypothetical protein